MEYVYEKKVHGEAQPASTKYCNVAHNIAQLFYDETRAVGEGSLCEAFQDVNCSVGTYWHPKV
jgi:hypothetical protein